MTAATESASPQELQRLLAGIAHEIRHATRVQGLLLKQMADARGEQDEAATLELADATTQLGFHVDNLIEAAYASAGVQSEAAAVDVDFVLARATHQFSWDVSVRPSGVVVVTHRYALAEMAREMVLLLSRAGMGRRIVLSASAGNGKLAIEAVATEKTPAVTVGRIRKEIDGVLLTLQRLSGAKVTPLKDGRGVRAVLPCREKPTRPLVLLFTQDRSLAQLVERSIPSQATELRWWPMSIPLLVTLQEVASPEQVALCIIDARARDDFLPRLYSAVAHARLRDRVVLVGVAETCPVPEVLAEFARVVPRGDLAKTMQSALGSKRSGSRHS